MTKIILKDNDGFIDYHRLRVLYFQQHMQQIVVHKSHFVLPIGLVMCFAWDARTDVG